MPSTVAYILGTILALGGTIVAFIMILPDKKRERLNGFMTWLHDFFNFKSLWLEKILKFLYVFNTLACICIGVFLLISADYGHYMGLYGILIIILGPPVMRVLYEFMMLIVLAVKNLMDINNKLVPQEGSVAADKMRSRNAPRQNPTQQVYVQQPQYVQPQYGQQDYSAPVQPGTDFNGPTQY